MAAKRKQTAKREQQLAKAAAAKGWQLEREGDRLILADAVTGSTRWAFTDVSEAEAWIDAAA